MSDEKDPTTRNAMQDKGKFEIDDIKDPEDDLDIDEVVAEEVSEKDSKIIENSGVIDETEPEVKEDISDKDVLEKVVEEEKTEPESSLKPLNQGKNKKSWKKFAIVGVVVAVITAATVLGIMYFLDQKKEPSTTVDVTEEVVEEPVVEEEAVATDKVLFINSEVGLNLREKPDAKAKVLVIIPFGTKITVLEEQTGWVKTTYESKTGWLSVDYTQATDPLVYEDKTYGFGLTFRPSWAGYKFIESSNEGSTTVKTYYVALPTADKKWKEPALPAGYASLFVMGVYTKAEWAKLAGGEMLPAKLGEGAKYVYTYLPGQAYASDLKTQYYEIKAIIDTFEVLN